MNRRLLKLLTVLSLLLCVAVCALWVRSYWVNDGFAYARPGWLMLGRVGRGRIMLMTMHRDLPVHGFERLRWKAFVDWDTNPSLPGTFGAGRDVRSDMRILGVHSASGTHQYPSRIDPESPDPAQRVTFIDYPYRLISVPLWLPTVVTLLPALPPLVRRILRLLPRHVPGTCRRCGYDLRATPERCPECGAKSPA